MKKLPFIFFFLFAITILHAQSKQETEIINACELLRKAMIAADSIQLFNIASDKLMYGHSSGMIENREQFVKRIISGQSKFISIDISQQTINMSGDVAVVHQKFDAVTGDSGKPGEVHLLIMLVWQKQHDHWVLLARQAVHAS